MQGEGPHERNKNQYGECHQPAKLAQSKESHQAAKPSKEDDNKNYKCKNKNKTLPVCPLHGTGHSINLFKIIQEQPKYMKLTWLTSNDRVLGRVRLQGAKKRPTEGQEINALVASALSDVLKQKNLQRLWIRTTPSRRMSRRTLT